MHSRPARPRACLRAVLHTSACALALAAAGASAAAAQVSPRPAKERAALLPVQAQWLAAAPRPATAVRFAAIPVLEVEPNDSLDTATPLTPGDEAQGVIDPPGDVDFFRFQLSAGVPVELEVNAARSGSGLDAVLYLLTADGTVVAANDDHNELDSFIRYTPAQSGQYWFAITDYSGRGGADFTYRVLTREVAPGPGDPTTVLAANLPGVWAAATGPGVLYVIVDMDVRRVTLTGQLSTLATGLLDPRGIAVDGAGNVLVTEITQSGGSRITRIQPDGTRSTFANVTGLATAVTIGPDGSVWVGDAGTQQLHRYDPSGTLRESIPAGNAAFGLMNLAFSPAGELHISDYSSAIYRLRNGAVEPVIQRQGVGGIAFDRDGYLYVGTISSGILLYDAAYGLVHAPFAVDGLDLTASVVFGRNAAGAMTSRLFGTNLAFGSIREVNPAGVRAPGHRIGVDLLTITTASLRAGVMGANYADTLRIQTGAATWSVVGGTLPAGLALDPATGVLAGIPQASGTSSVTFRAQADGRIGERSYTLGVTRPVVDASTAAEHLLGVSGVLSDDVLRFLDLQGNRNGRFDIGDLQAFLRNQN